jgi:hypothetical protein
MFVMQQEFCKRKAKSENLVERLSSLQFFWQKKWKTVEKQQVYSLIAFRFSLIPAFHSTFSPHNSSFSVILPLQIKN